MEFPELKFAPYLPLSSALGGPSTCPGGYCGQDNGLFVVVTDGRKEFGFPALALLG